jgi:CDGSH-type Zn-finger protein/uncharacterized Fe-S cluster protein YjdI
MSQDVQEYRGEKIVVRFDGSKCIHSRSCVLGRPDVFVANAEGPWIQPDNASAEAVAAVARSCPSGAITYERLDGGEQEAPPLVNQLRVLENGPLAVVADLQIDGHGTAARATLCRCGATKNPPFCDGAHTAAGFRATGEPDARPGAELSARGGPIKVSGLPNGPLVLTGNLEVCSGTGRAVTKGQRTVFCRCGGSQMKPYCDGTHRTIGFQAP